MKPPCLKKYGLPAAVFKALKRSRDFIRPQAAGANGYGLDRPVIVYL